jgi:hypothetical protein
MSVGILHSICLTSVVRGCWSSALQGQLACNHMASGRSVERWLAKREVIIDGRDTEVTMATQVLGSYSTLLNTLRLSTRGSMYPGLM